MALAFDKIGHNYINVSTASGTVSIAAGATNSIAIMGVEYASGAGATFTSLTVGGSSTGVTQIGAEVVNNGRSFRLYYFLNPSTSTTSYVLTIGNTNINTDGDIYVSIYSGAAQSGQPNSNSSGTVASGTLTLSTTVVASNCWLVSYVTNPAGATAASTGTTDRSPAGTNESRFGDSNATVGTGSQSMAWSNASNAYGGIIASIAPVAAAAATLPYRALMGVGI